MDIHLYHMSEVCLCMCYLNILATFTNELQTKMWFLCTSGSVKPDSEV